MQYDHMNPNTILFAEVAVSQNGFYIQQLERFVDRVFQFVINGVQYLCFYLHLITLFFDTVLYLKVPIYGLLKQYVK